MNHQRINQKLKEIEENLELIKENLPQELDEFLTLGLVKDGIYKKLEYSIQNLIDICSIIYTTKKLGVPSSLEDIFQTLAKQKIFSKEIMALIQEMKGLRNILVHQYGKIEDARVFEFLQSQLTDFDKIIKAIEKVIKLI